MVVDHLLLGELVEQKLAAHLAAHPTVLPAAHLADHLADHPVVIGVSWVVAFLILAPH